MMIAVYLPMIGSAVPAWVWVAGLLLAAGLSPLATWGARAVRSQLARRFLLALVIAFVFARATYAVICPSCFGCDPWWLEWFWICLP